MNQPDQRTRQAVNERLNAFTAFATRQAAGAPARGPARLDESGESSESGEGVLRGVTVGVKANIAVKGLPWTAGLEAQRERIAAHDAETVGKLRKAGATILGMLNMEEAALGAKTDNFFFGATQNPHKLGFTPGGSSGGSGAAVAAGLCDVALGTDTLGSVRIPAAYCGIYGLKPTHGAVSQKGLELVEASLDSIGPLARSLERLEATARVLLDFKKPHRIDSIALLDNPGLENPGLENSSLKSPRPENPDRKTSPKNPDTVECEAAVLGGYHKAKRILCPDSLCPDSFFSLPYPLARIRFAGFIIASRGLCRTLEKLLEDSPDKFSEPLKKLLTYGRKRSAENLAEDQEVLTQTRKALRAVLERQGAILLPATPQAAFSHCRPAPANQADFTCLASIAGLPSLTLPSGWNEEGLPVAVQLIAAADNEAGLFELAKKLDRKLSAYRLPDIFLESKQSNQNKEKKLCASLLCSTSNRESVLPTMKNGRKAPIFPA